MQKLRRIGMVWFQGLMLVYLQTAIRYISKYAYSPDGDYVELGEMHSPKKMLQFIGKIRVQCFAAGEKGTA